MTPAEITKELDELDVALERLRIKYDQYFTGTERMLPWVARKAVDRRFHALHREQMRNTGIRFRFNTLVSRFTTYQTHWGRILRQIEEGTWKRDVVRAQRLGLKPPIDRSRKKGDEAGKKGSEEPEELSPDQLEEVEESGAMLGSRGDREEIPDSLFGAWRPDPAHSREELPTGMDFDTDDPMPEEAPVRAERVVPLPVERIVSVPAPTAAPVSASSPSIPVVAPESRPRPVLSPFGSMRAPSPLRTEPPSMAPVSVQITQPPPARVVAPPPGVVLPPPGAVVPPRPAEGTAPITGTGIRGAPLRPAVPKPAPAPAPSRTADDDPARQLYKRLLEAREKTGEGGAVSFEAVKRQMNEAIPRLREKFQGADVKLDVAIKDGKAILRPVVTVKKKP